MKQAWYSKKWVVVFLHVAAWALLFSLPFLLRPSYENNGPHHEKHNEDFNSLLKYFLTDLLWISIFYLNAYVLIPRFIYKKKYWNYALLQTAIIIILVFCDWMFSELLVHVKNFQVKPALLFAIFPLLFLIPTIF